MFCVSLAEHVLRYRTGQNANESIAFLRIDGRGTPLCPPGWSRPLLHRTVNRLFKVSSRGGDPHASVQLCCSGTSLERPSFASRTVMTPRARSTSRRWSPTVSPILMPKEPEEGLVGESAQRRAELAGCRHQAKHFGFLPQVRRRALVARSEHVVGAGPRLTGRSPAGNGQSRAPC